MAKDNGNGEWRFDLNKWTLEDYIQFSSTEKTLDRIVWIGKTIVSTPFAAKKYSWPLVSSSRVIPCCVPSRRRGSTQTAT